MIVKWDKLKEKAILAAVGNLEYTCEMAAPLALIAGIGDGTYDWKRNSREMREAVIRVIEKWDIRRAKALIDLFPGIVPKRCAGKVPECFMAEDGGWTLEYV